MYIRLLDITLIDSHECYGKIVESVYTFRYINKDLEELERRLDALDDDPIMRMVTAIYEDRIRKAKAKAQYEG
jgi:hypothetical protein